eukprot:Gregarina_sp_Pseudo_9__5236@NODE_58_length_4716_cov_37_865298_g54_i0_p2_GENE_NODE_58_length_4716_cov_37_865298_g54_i0NODE_58_length_4716_cov_37_865298_g54_i0_p2_ORF_typecomplete_len311_score89_59_NODE_58_length_4716_cov_37_865298_g54_i015722504
MLFKIDEDRKWDQSTTALSASRVRDSSGDDEDLESVPRPSRDGYFSASRPASLLSDGGTSAILSRHTFLSPPLVPSRSYFSALPAFPRSHFRPPSAKTAPPAFPAQNPLLATARLHHASLAAEPKVSYNIVNHYSPIVHVHVADATQAPQFATHPTQGSQVARSTGQGSAFLPPTQRALQNLAARTELESATSAFHSSDFYAEASLSNYSQYHPLSFDASPPVLPVSRAPVSRSPVSAPRVPPLSRSTRSTHLPTRSTHLSHKWSPSTHRLIAPSATSGRRSLKQGEEDSVVDWGDCAKLAYWRQVLCCE